MNPILTASIAALAVLLFSMGVGLVHAARAADRISARLGVVSRPSVRRERTPWLAGASDRFATTAVGRRLQAYARKTHPSTAFSDIVAWSATGVIAGAFLAYMVFGSGPMVLLGAVAGPIVTDRIAVRMSGRRVIRMEAQLPDALYLQASSLRAGHSTARSLEVMAGQTSGPIGQELKETMRAVDLGVPLERTLDDLTERTGSRDIELWVTAMQVHRATGGNLTSIIESLAAQIKERAQMRAEIRALTAQGRLSGSVVASAPVAFFVLLSVTAREQMAVLYSTSTGLMLLAAGIALEAAGFLWIRWILRIRA